MRLIDVGSGPPVVLVPGIQGRWEWMRPAVDALARRLRVITFSLADEPTCRGRFDEHEGFWCYVRQIEEAMDASGIERAAVCGVSYGGLIAAAFAARHPGRVSGLILVSALPPAWTPDFRARFYLRAPRLLFPVFILMSARMYPEIAAANGTLAAGLAAATRHAWNVLRHMLSPARLARRVRMLLSVDLQDELAPLTLPTLVITGEDGLDRVVPPARTREYLQMWPHAAGATLERTGHLGLITKPDAFAALVVPFVTGVSPAHDTTARTTVERRERIG
jgi:pimeloyl-ACP methyl ester carboxylesterase